MKGITFLVSPAYSLKSTMYLSLFLQIGNNANIIPYNIPFITLSNKLTFRLIKTKRQIISRTLKIKVHEIKSQLCK